MSVQIACEHHDSLKAFRFSFVSIQTATNRRRWSRSLRHVGASGMTRLPTEEEVGLRADADILLLSDLGADSRTRSQSRTTGGKRSGLSKRPEEARRGVRRILQAQGKTSKVQEVLGHGINPSHRTRGSSIAMAAVSSLSRQECVAGCPQKRTRQSRAVHVLYQ